MISGHASGGPYFPSMTTWIIAIICIFAAHQCWIRGAGGRHSMRLWGIGLYGLALFLISESAFNFTWNIFKAVALNPAILSMVVVGFVCAGLFKMMTGKWHPRSR